MSERPPAPAFVPAIGPKPQLNFSAQQLVVALDAAHRRTAHDADTAHDYWAQGRAVQAVLQDWVRGGGVLPPACLHTGADGYARHALHLDKLGRFAIIVMVWAPGQGAPVHDHGGLVCTEALYQGRLTCQAFTEAGREGDVYTLRAGPPFEQQRGEAEVIVPPPAGSELHSIRNCSDQQAVTIHVYGGPLDQCSMYKHLGGDAYQRIRKPLFFHKAWSDGWMTDGDGWEHEGAPPILLDGDLNPDAYEMESFEDYSI